MFCPECGSEYRAGFTTCADCRVPLVDAPPRSETGGDPGPVQLLLLCVTREVGDLALVRCLLDSVDVPYVLNGGVRGPGAQVLVAVPDFGRARAALAKLQ